MYIVTSLNQLIAPETDANGGASQVYELMTVGALELDGVLWFVPIVTFTNDKGVPLARLTRP